MVGAHVGGRAHITARKQRGLAGSHIPLEALSQWPETLHKAHLPQVPSPPNSTTLGTKCFTHGLLGALIHIIAGVYSRAFQSFYFI
jgi:hypothetical protein